QSGDPVIDPEFYQRDDMRAAIARHGFGTVYQALRDEQGLSQRRIANLTGQSQSEVSEILSGRQVLMYSVLRRIVTGLAIPPEIAGLSCHDGDDPGTYSGQGTVVDSEEVEALLRRHLLALGGKAITGATVAKLGALFAELPGPPPVPLPPRLDHVHVMQVRDLTRRLGVGDSYGNPQVCSSAAAWATGLLGVPGTDTVRRALKVAAAELHIEAGWTAFDAGLCQRALYHYSRSLELATEAGDLYLQTLSLNYAASVTVETGHPDEGLKLRQCAQVTAGGIPADDHRAVVVGETGKTAVQACAMEGAALALADMGDVNGADVQLMKGREVWTPTRTDPFGDMDRPAARLEMARGRLDSAEQFAVASVRRWEGGRLISRTTSSLVLATVYVTAGDSRGLPLAHQTLTDAAKLSSARVRRQWVLPLADALDTRPGTDARDLARQARQVAAS
ncbi:MAG: helix-turn-helix domain-containing protein, partial [Pseudonocardiaceae bacterium]